MPITVPEAKKSKDLHMKQMVHIYFSVNLKTNGVKFLREVHIYFKRL